MTKSLVVLKNHFGGNDTLVVQIEGQKYVSNGCQTFHCDELDEVCAEFSVSNTDKQMVLDSLNEINSDCADLLKVIEMNMTFFKYIENHTEEICLAVAKKDKHALKCLKIQTEEICLAAVRQHGHALRFVKNQTPEICLAAVKQNGMALRYVKEQTEEICLAAIKETHWASRFVKNKIPDILLAAES